MDLSKKEQFERSKGKGSIDSTIFPFSKSPKKPRRRPSRSSSYKREKKTAENWGGKRTPRSGGGSLKGDVFLDDILIEDKARQAKEKSVRIEFGWIEKINVEAQEMGKKLGFVKVRPSHKQKCYIIADEERFRLYILGLKTELEISEEKSYALMERNFDLRKQIFNLSRRNPKKLKKEKHGKEI